MVLSDSDLKNDDFLYPDETHKIIGCAFEVYNNLGFGFLEEVYHEALELEFAENNISFLHKPFLNVYYKESLLVHYYQPDILCFENRILLELKAINSLTVADDKQIINYLKGTGVQVGLIINFGKRGRLEWKRVVYSDKRYLRNVSVSSKNMLKKGGSNK